MRNSVTQNQENEEDEKGNRRLFVLMINYLLLFVGSISSTLLSKFYFIHKGSSRWVSTWVQSAGFPLLVFPICIPFYLFKSTQRRPFHDFTPKMFILSILVGLMLGLNNLLFSWGNSYLPVSISSLLLSSQLVFNLILSVIIVKQKITFHNLNCVILLSLSSLLLALNSGHHQNPNGYGLTKTNYFIGFFCTIGASLLFALYLPIIEKIYKNVKCYEMVMEMQLVMEIAATVLATIGMALDGGFWESKGVFDKGEKLYWVVIIGNVVTWQLCFMGTAGLVFLTCSLTGGICMTAVMGMNVLGGVFVYGEEFGGVKVVSTLLCAWGFSSYVYGMHLNIKHQKDQLNKNQNLPMDVVPPDNV